MKRPSHEHVELRMKQIAFARDYLILASRGDDYRAYLAKARKLRAFIAIGKLTRWEARAVERTTRFELAFEAILRGASWSTVERRVGDADRVGYHSVEKEWLVASGYARRAREEGVRIDAALRRLERARRALLRLRTDHVLRRANVIGPALDADVAAMREYIQSRRTRRADAATERRARRPRRRVGSSRAAKILHTTS